ncbi:MAG TPA: NADH:ubiquinone oxidoreductase subunit N, partial [Coxiellaceae bacterium]|nr:NADH:ubiquinone oxidoreductase subunit N [Coxiellaceae bacterium]
MSAFLSYVFPASAECFVLVASCVILMAGVFFPKRESLCYYLTQFTVLVAMVLTVWVFAKSVGAQGQPLYAYSQGYILDRLAVALKLLTLLCSFFTFIYARSYNRVFNLP